MALVPQSALGERASSPYMIVVLVLVRGSKTCLSLIRAAGTPSILLSTTLSFLLCFATHCQIKTYTSLLRAPTPYPTALVLSKHMLDKAKLSMLKGTVKTLPLRTHCIYKPGLPEPQRPTGRSIQNISQCFRQLVLGPKLIALKHLFLRTDNYTQHWSLQVTGTN